MFFKNKKMFLVKKDIKKSFVKHKGNLIVIDSNNDICNSNLLKEETKEIFKFKADSEISCKYNPLSEIRIMSEYEKEDMELISNILAEKFKSKDIFLDLDIARLISGGILYIIYKNFLMNPKFIVKNGEKIPKVSSNMSEVLEFIEEFKSNKKEILNENFLKKYAKNEKIKEMVENRIIELYKEKLNTHPLLKEYLKSKVCLSDLILDKNIELSKKALSIFKKNNVKANTEYSDFMIDELMRKENILIYSNGNKEENILLSKILFSQITNFLCDFNLNKKAKTLIIINDFFEFDKIEILEKGIEYFQKFNIEIILRVKNLEQFNIIYRRNPDFLSKFKIIKDKSIEGGKK